MTERLETIKKLVKKIESILYDEWRQQELTNLIESLYYDDHVDWLLNRIEELEMQLSINTNNMKQLQKENERYKQRNEELEKELTHQTEHFDICYHVIEKEKKVVEEQNQRYKQALEFYADEENYCVTFEDDYEPILKDNGKIARQTLEGEE